MNTNKTQYGALVSEWAHFDILLGLTPDLLPVVSNPNADIAPNSRIKSGDRGKVPSTYNKHNQVIGIPDWTRRVASDLDLDRWQKQQDYGICIQTRQVRALDIDIPDEELATRVVNTIYNEFGIKLPRRYRDNSFKTLLALVIKGEMPKRVIKVREKIKQEDGTVEPAWLIEFLATGNQFIAAGTHFKSSTNGLIETRIQWEGGLPDYIPEIRVDQFEKLWTLLQKLFACAPSTVGSIRKKGQHFKAEDLVATKLLDRGLSLGIGNDGQILIDCPWKENHSMDSGVTQTAYFPIGSGGYQQGHFKCLHAGCAEYTDVDFEECLGLRDDMFEIFDEQGEPLELPNWSRNKIGQVEANLTNIKLALSRPDICGKEIRYDRFTDKTRTRLVDSTKWHSITDGDAIHLRERLENVYSFRPIGRELMRDSIISHCERHSFDSAIEWLQGLPAWDGQPRIDNFMAQYFGAEPNEYSTAVGRYLWSALAGRCLVPGIKADMALVLQGDQGVIKSTAIAALAPFPSTFSELSLGDKEEVLARKLRGKLVIELGELRGFYSKELEAIKAFISHPFDEWVPKYREETTRLMRRCIFIGTTNHAEFLIDETGNRRFLPITVKKADLTRIQQDRIQLWAEGLYLFLEEGVCWRDAEELARDEHSKFTVHDSWEDDIAQWLEREGIDGLKPMEKEYIQTSEVLREALNIEPRNSHNGLEKRAAKVLRTLGWRAERIRIKGKNPVRVYRNPLKQ